MIPDINKAEDESFIVDLDSIDAEEIEVGHEVRFLVVLVFQRVFVDPHELK